MAVQRLTYRERRDIAAGLAEGLAYAEIARRLDRPKSTVVREVARNGGPRHYRANTAQQAASWRARRRPAPAPPDAPVPADPPRTRAAFAEEFAAMMRRTGVPPMMARVLVALFTSEDGGLTAADLVARLHVSPASVSKAVAWLRERGMLTSEREGRRTRHLADPHFWYRSWEIGIRTMTLWRDTTRHGADLYGPGSPVGARLRAAGEFFARVTPDMERMAENWRRFEE